MIVNIDFAGLEWRTVLEWTEDKTGLEEVLSGADAHSDNQKFFGLPSRLIAKVFLFRAIFRGKPFAYANDPDFMAVSKDVMFWEDVISRFYKKYSGIAKRHEECLKEVYRNKGIYVHPFSGREFEFKKYEKRGVADYNDSEVVNFPVQSFGADIVCLFRTYVQVRILRAGYQNRIILLATVHDSCVWDVADRDAYLFLLKVAHEAFEQLSNMWKFMYGMSLQVPHGYEVEAGTSYGTAKSIIEEKCVLYKPYDTFDESIFTDGC